jgi:tetratricopeptide (TPR) repeat protein
MSRAATAFAFALLLAGCYNPVNEATANRYAQMCREAEADGRLGGAEEACRRALINVRIGHLGAAAESQALYNLGRLKRKMQKFNEAEELLKESLKVQETISPADQARIGRRLAEIAAVYGQTSRYKDGWPFVQRLMPFPTNYSGQERVFVKLIFQTYAQELRKLGMEVEASQLEENMRSL